MRRVWFAIEGRPLQVNEIAYGQGPQTVGAMGKRAVGVVCMTLPGLCAVDVYDDVVLVQDPDHMFQVSIAP